MKHKLIKRYIRDVHRVAKLLKTITIIVKNLIEFLSIKVQHPPIAVGGCCFSWKFSNMMNNSYVLIIS